MYPPLPLVGEFKDMIGESLCHHIESSIDNVENNRPSTNLNKSRQALFKKGSRRARSSASDVQNKNHQTLHQHQKHSGLLRSNQVRLADINNNHTTIKTSSKSPIQTNLTLEFSTTRTPGSVVTHFKPGTKKELLKSKAGKLERASQPSGPSVHSFNKNEQTAQNLNVRSQRSRYSNVRSSAPSSKKCENSSHRNSSSPVQFSRKDGKKPLHQAQSVKIVNVYSAEPTQEDNLKDGEKTYAGAKFSEPPSPSVLPKPPSHWVGEKTPQNSDNSREQMTVHLKTLLKVQAKP
ncbi:proline-rich nuclear receptor coactivator 1 [Chanos chanos]|uniref:Proline-rich nuclear receptor coactivator 1 n=1 Tax=Chanos chanos TaxID=29144 RepID=A0A6J2VZ77_CHACN|nr:proline-rich nuclear receptor coactivator 1 [Chanos chanos]